MNMAEAIIITSLISSIFGLIGIANIQKFWDHKWDKNFEFEKFKIRERNKAAKRNQTFKMKHPEPKNVVNKAMDLIPLLNRLDPEQIKKLIDTFMPKEYEYEESNTSDAIADLIGGVDPAMIKGFLEGLSKSKKKSSGSSDKDFWE